jgi:glyoxylase-like metal-dependent hydrolase (beta-lactamase superfamily II)
MYDSLFNVLGRLDGSTTLFPGHDYGDVKVSNLARERERNPYFQLRDRAAFVKHRLTPR